MSHIGRRGFLLGAGGSILALAGAKAQQGGLDPVPNYFSGTGAASTWAREKVGLPDNTLGGLPIGAKGLAGTFREGYILRHGSEFNDGDTLPVFDPVAHPEGRFINSRSNQHNRPMAAPRSREGQGYVADGHHSGHFNTNRDRKVDTFNDIVQVRDSKLILRGRGVTKQERALTDNWQGSLIAFLGDMQCYFIPPTIIEALISVPTFRKGSAVANGIGFWMDPMGPFSKGDAIERDFDVDPELGTWSQATYRWRDDGTPLGVYNISQISTHGNPGLWNRQFYLLSIKALWDKTEHYINDTWAFTATQDVIAENGGVRPYYVHLTSHMNEDQLRPFGKIVEGQVEWFRIWGQAGVANRHRKPLKPTAPIFVDFGATPTIQLATMQEQWGATGLEVDVVSAVPYSARAPGGNRCGGFKGKKLPEDIIVQSGNSLIGNFKDQPGNLHVLRVGGARGDTVEPDVIDIYVGPRILIPATVNYALGVPLTLDLFHSFDCGNIGPAVVTHTGLPAGLTMQLVSGPDRLKLMGTPTAYGSTTFTLRNAFGQSVNKTITFAAPVAGTGTPLPLLPNFATLAAAGLLASIDPDKQSSLTFSSGAFGAGGKVSSIAGADGTPYAASQAVVGQQPTSVLVNGRGALAFDGSLLQFLDWSTALAGYGFGLPTGMFSMMVAVQLDSIAAPQQTYLSIDHSANPSGVMSAMIRSNKVQFAFFGGGAAPVAIPQDIAIGYDPVLYAPVDTKVHQIWARRNGAPRQTVTGEWTSGAQLNFNLDGAFPNITEVIASIGTTFSGGVGTDSPPDKITLGAQWNSGAPDFYLRGKILRALIFKRFLDDHEMNLWAMALKCAIGGMS